jgi:peptidyl-prolyl cis-trans isomerase SurA
MRERILIALLALSLPLAAAGQQVVDRIVARVDSDVITQSELDELGDFQRLVSGKAQTPDQRLRELVEQWMVGREASYSGYHPPTADAVDKAYADLEKRSASPEAFAGKMKELGLTKADVRKMLERQLVLSGYLDYKFRPQVQVAEKDVEEYYRKTLVPELQREGQPVPPLENVSDRIREVLIERGISRLSAEWLDQMKERWKVERVGGPVTP